MMVMLAPRRDRRTDDQTQSGAHFGGSDEISLYVAAIFLPGSVHSFIDIINLSVYIAAVCNECEIKSSMTFAPPIVYTFTLTGAQRLSKPEKMRKFYSTMDLKIGKRFL